MINCTSFKINIQYFYTFPYQQLIVYLSEQQIQLGIDMEQNKLTRPQQNYRVVFLGIIFMLMFTAFNSLQNTVSNIYDDQGFTNLGKISLLFLYFVFGISTFFTGFFIRKFGYNKVLFVSALGYALYEVSGLIIAMWEDIPKPLGWFIVMFGAATCGAGASAIWVAQGSYVSTVAGEQRKTQLFGLFWMLMMASQILGNVIITFVLGLIGKVAYFIVLTVLGGGSAFLFLLLPKVKQEGDGEEVTVKKEAKKIFKIIGDKKYRYFVIYLYFPGVTIGFYATFLATLVKLCLPQEADQNDQDYTSRIDYLKGYVFIALGVSQTLTGLVMNQCFQKFCKFKLAIIGTGIVEIAAIASMLCFFLESYGLCFVVSMFWGIAETFLQTNTGALIGKIFPNKVEAFSVFRVVFAFGTVTTIVLNIALESLQGWIFLTVILLIQMFTMGIATQIMDLKTQIVALEQQKTDSGKLLSKDS